MEFVYLVRIIEGEKEYDFKYFGSKEKAEEEIDLLNQRNKYPNRFFNFVTIKVH